MPTNKVIKGVCAECQRPVTIKARGLCSPCYLRPAVRNRHAAMERQAASRIGGKNRQAGWRATAGMIGGEYMPSTVFAVVRVIRSYLCGRLRVLVAWFKSPDDAAKYAAKRCQRFSVRVEQWSTLGKKGVRKLATQPVAVYPRRGGKRVAA